LSAYKKASTFTGMNEKDRFINMLVGLIFYFICTDIINLVRIPLKRKINKLIGQVKKRKIKGDVNVKSEVQV